MEVSARKIVQFLFLFAFFSLSVLAQDDPNPDSPTPVILSEFDGASALYARPKTSKNALPGSPLTVNLSGGRTSFGFFVTNVDMLAGEGANAFRVYLRQKSGLSFQLPVESLNRVKGSTYAVKVSVNNPQNGWRQPLADGGSLIYLTWRGLSSNYLKVTLGSGADMAIPSAKASAPDSTVPEYVGYRWSGDRVRFLEQAAFGPTTDLDNRIRRIGLRTWLAEQFEAPYPTMPFPDPPQMPTTVPSDCTAATNPFCFRERYTMTPVQRWFFLEAMYGDAQLRHRTAWAMSQIWVTSGVAVQQAAHEIAFHKILTQNAFGNYRQLMYEATLSPTMGFYLDMVRSTKANPNENYPREIMQLFSIGLYMLNQDGTVMLDQDGDPIPTYSQDTVNNLSKVMTGWTYCNLTCTNSAPGILNYKDPMIVSPANHDTTAKTLLNYPNAVSPTIPACANCGTDVETKIYAEDSLNKALDNLFYHPNVGPFVSGRLIQHLVTSDPSPAYIERVAAVFNNNGSGIRGDMKAVIKAILLDPEARGNVKTAPRYGKLREPVQLLTNLGRIFPARDFNGTSISDGALSSHSTRLGQNPFNSPTVFNYFTPEYIVPGTTVLAPEFEILNTGTAINRTNLLHTLVFEGITANATDSLRGTSLDYSEVLPFAEADPNCGQLLDVLNTKMMHGAMVVEQRNSIITALQAVPASNPLLRVKTAVYLIAASSQYQIQR
jgi:uncharacterized protein (DUF1800 family)